MRIAFLITRGDFPGGAQVHLRDLCRALQAKGHDILVLAGCPDLLGEDLFRLGIPVHPLRHLVQPLHPYRDLLAWLEILRALRAWRPELVAAHSSKAGLLSRIAAAFLGLPNVFTAHGWSFTEGVSPLKRSVYRTLEALTIRLADRVICVSDYDRNLAIRERVGPTGAMVTIHNGIPNTAPSRTDTTRGEGIRLIMVARLGDPKQPEQIIEGLCDLPDKVTLDLVGEGPRRKDLERLAAALGLTERVRFLGHRDNVPDYLAEADVFVLTSRYEAFPLSILEAMRAGLPVVASDVGGVHEAVIHGQTGFLVPRNDKATLTDCIGRLAADGSLRARLGQAGRARFLDHFTHSIMVDKTESVFTEILSSRSLKRGEAAQGRPVRP